MKGLADFNEWVTEREIYVQCNRGLFGNGAMLVFGLRDEHTDAPPWSGESVESSEWIKENIDWYGVANCPVEAMRKCVDKMKKYYFEELNGQRVPVR